VSEEIDISGDGYQKIQQFVTDSPWSAEGVMRQAAQSTSALYAGQPDYDRGDVGYIVDESAHLRQGKYSVGVSRQYAGTVGKVENCKEHEAMKAVVTGPLLTAGLAVGTVRAAPTAIVEGGVTRVTLAPELVQALSERSIAPSAVAPANLNAKSGRVSLPIPGGALDLQDLAGNLLHLGGLVLSSADTRVALLYPIVDTTDGHPVLSSLVLRALDEAANDSGDGCGDWDGDANGG
jgi:hypothetical protein